MSLLPNQSYANPDTPLWAAAGGGGGYPLNPTFTTVTMSNGGDDGYLTAGNVGPAGSALLVGTGGNGAPLATGRLSVYDSGNPVSGNNGRAQIIGSDTGMSIDWIEGGTNTTYPFMSMGPTAGEVLLSGIKSINGNGYFAPTYGSFSSTQIQPISAVSATPIVFDTADVTPAGITWTGPSANIQADLAGTYKVLASIQCDKTGGGSAELDMWVAINGNAVPNSASKLEINQNQESVMTVEWLLSLGAGDNVSIECFDPTGSTDLRLLAVPAAPIVPAVPSIITTIQRIA